MSLSLSDINQALKPYRKEVELQLTLENQISALKHQLASHQENLRHLDQALAKEWADVEALTQSKWRNFWQSLQLEGTKDLQLEKEQKEWEMVRDERQELISLIAEIEEALKSIEANHLFLGELDTSLQALLHQKHEIFMASARHDVYQGLVTKERAIEHKVQSLDKMAADLILLIDHLQKLEVLLQAPSPSRHNHRSITYYLDHADDLLHHVAKQLQQTDWGLALDPSMLQGFERQLSGSRNAKEWLAIMDRFQGNAQICLTQIQSKEAIIRSQAEMVKKRRQKFLFESY